MTVFGLEKKVLRSVTSSIDSVGTSSPVVSSRAKRGIRTLRSADPSLARDDRGSGRHKYSPGTSLPAPGPLKLGKPAHPPGQPGRLETGRMGLRQITPRDDAHQPAGVFASDHWQTSDPLQHHLVGGVT